MLKASRMKVCSQDSKYNECAFYQNRTMMWMMVGMIEMKDHS